MARKSSKSQVKDAAIKRAMAGENVDKIARDVGVSRAGLYLWIRRAKADAAARASAGVTGKTKDDNHVMTELEVRGLREENERLKQRLFELMVKHGLL